jgi:hypothetical protein
MRKAAGMARKVQEVAAVRDAVVRDAAVDGDRVMGALCAVAGVCANEVLGMRAYDDRYVVVVADGRKLAVPATTIFEYTIQAALDEIPMGSEEQ